MEVFLAFYSEDQATSMLDTAKRWAKCRGAVPNVIQVPEKNFEIKRRVLADNLAKEEYYILSDIACSPGDVKLIKYIKERLKHEPNIVLAGLVPHDLHNLQCKLEGTAMYRDGALCLDEADCERCWRMKYYRMLPNIPSGIRICKKGAIDKWPQQLTIDYNFEHAEAAKKSIIELPENIIKQRVKVWEDIFYANFTRCSEN